jgi:transposase
MERDRPESLRIRSLTCCCAFVAGAVWADSRADSVLVQDIPEPCLKTSRSDVASHPGLSLGPFQRPGMTLNRLLITSVVVENRPVRDVAAQYGVSESWLFELLARYRAEGEAAFEPRSRRPHSVPTATPTETIDLILELREKLTATGLDAGPDTIKWHLEHHHSIAVSRATISRYLAKAGLVVPDPKKKPKSSYIRFAAEMPNETWQSDFTHYRLRRPDGRPGADTRS